MAKPALSVGAILLVSWTIVYSGHAQPVAADKLNKASECQVAPVRFIPGQQVSGPMTLKNDGGWCWSVGYASQGSNMYLSAGDVVVKDPPKHGRVYPVIDTDRTYQVTVSR